MTWQSNYWDSLKAVIAASWPEMVGRPYPALRRDVAMERVNWGNLIQEGKLAAPWVIVQIKYETATDGPANWPSYNVFATIWYVAEVLNEDSATAVLTIEGKLETLRQAMMIDQTLGTTYSEAPIDTSAENPVNETFLFQQVPFQAGSITFQTLVVAVTQ